MFFFRYLNVFVVPNLTYFRWPKPHNYFNSNFSGEGEQAEATAEQTGETPRETTPGGEQPADQEKTEEPTTGGEQSETQEEGTAEETEGEQQAEGEQAETTEDAEAADWTPWGES